MTKRLGTPLLQYETIGSTSDVARDLAAHGAAEGTAVVASEQTAGRGRMGRSWSSPAGEGLYLSLVLRPNMTPADSTVITLAAAVAVGETLQNDFSVPADIKWPNDVLVRGKKICGILLESAVEAGELRYGVLGIGVNLMQRDFPDVMRETATSLLIESGRSVPWIRFLPPLIRRLDSWYNLVLASPREVLARFEAMSSFARNCAVLVVSPAGTFTGVTRGLGATGGLRIELPQGEIREILSGEVSLRKSPQIAAE